MQRLFRALLIWVLPHPSRFRLALRLARLAKPAAPTLGKVAALRPMAAMLALAPARLDAAPSRDDARVVNAKGRVALLGGCAEPVLRPEFRAAAVRRLNRAGYDVIFASGEGCCGALVHHIGRNVEALSAARRNVDAWTREIERDGLVAILVTASGCGTMLKDYAFMLRDDPAYAEKAAHVSVLARDITELLIERICPRAKDAGFRLPITPPAPSSMAKK